MLFGPSGSCELGVASRGIASRESRVGKSRRCKARTFYFVDELVIGVLPHVPRKLPRVFHHVTLLDLNLAREL